jgi:hypothetical protein
MGAVNMHMTLEVAREKVAAGAAFLDGVPATADWRASIDRVNFSLNDPYKCILGQLFGYYYDGARVLSLTNADQSNLGFTYWGLDSPDMEDEESWVNLNDAWIEELTRDV